MSIEMRLGARGNLLQPAGDSYKQVQLKSPILLESELGSVQVRCGHGYEADVSACAAWILGCCMTLPAGDCAGPAASHRMPEGVQLLATTL